MIYRSDTYLEPYKAVIESRNRRLLSLKQEMAGYGGKISDVSNNHLFYGVHFSGNEVFLREWAPNATALYLIGECSGWSKEERFRFRSLGRGDWELVLPSSLLPHGSLYRWLVEWEGGSGERLPAYTERAVQDPESKIFSAQIWHPAQEYVWINDVVQYHHYPLIYEAHIGMASEEGKVCGFDEFRINVLPRVKDLGYNTLQLMALQEHPYYASFGYQVSNFYALSSRYGTPEEFKHLVDEAHGMGIAVIMDLVHSHAVKNECEGIGMIDGTDYAYCHSGERGRHPAWGSRCFDYGKPSTRAFLLSNIKYWMEEYHLDGFRFDGVTSMIYLDHGLGRSFSGYDSYFDGGEDEDALLYLGLANTLVKEINPRAITIAEEVSGMPGLAAPVTQGGWGFDFRLSMGVADHWIKWIDDMKDEEWSMGEFLYELTNRRADEKSISYAESHDQALVGDKTLIFRMIDKDMYSAMGVGVNNGRVERGVALHKMIRLVTLATAGDGYLSFMGNEFGHPEWIDFPRQGNGDSYHYARRQWSLADNNELRYSRLNSFDKAMIHLFGSDEILSGRVLEIVADEVRKVLIFGRGCYIFALNFHPDSSVESYGMDVPEGEYEVVLDSDAREFDGYGRVDDSVTHRTVRDGDRNLLRIYLPCRSAIVLRRLDY